MLVENSIFEKTRHYRFHLFPSVFQLGFPPSSFEPLTTTW